ncbi:hypothetical protein [Pseudomonas viridiflava]|uniref:hypothetical protein n=1 Tax=Pseudomonas viridiflava TaxID=33069 RepID=UPI000F021CA5|nr:hypothetical protein [Pseudomonas viridiflava]
MRKPIQIQAVQVDVPLPTQRGTAQDIQLFALCDDGTLWSRLVNQGDTGWERIESIPQGKNEPATDKPAQAGKRWETEDDQQLVALWHQERLACAQIAEKVHRTPGAIISRLVHLDIFDDRDAVRDADKARQALLTTSKDQDA